MHAHAPPSRYAYNTNRSSWLFISNCLNAFSNSSTKGNQTLLCHLGSAQGSSYTQYKSSSAAWAHYLLYLPLYNGVLQLSIGHSSVGNAVVEPGTGTALDKGRGRPPLVWFGTSITQGGAASRPGAQFINGVARSLNRPVINWGFAGSGKRACLFATHVHALPRPSLFFLNSPSPPLSLSLSLCHRHVYCNLYL